MPIPALRAKQSTTTTGTGTLTLLAAPTNARGFQAAFGVSSIVVRYVISGASFFEVGVGTFNGGSPGTLTRSTVLASSNAGALVSLPAGTADVFAWIDAAQRSLIESASTSLTLTLADLGNQVIWTGTSAGTLNLPAIATVPPGSAIDVRHAGTAVLTLDPNAAETVNGLTTLALMPGDAVTLIATTTGWFTAQPLPESVWLRSFTISAAATQDIVLPAGFGRYGIDLYGLSLSSASASLRLRTSTDGGATFASAASDYGYGYTFTQMGSSPGNSAISSDSSIDLAAALAASDTRNIVRILLQPGGASAPAFLFADAAVIEAAPNYRLISTAGARAANGLVNAVRLLTSAGTFTATAVLRGLR
jgi:hypothetical protein